MQDCTLYSTPIADGVFFTKKDSDPFTDIALYRSTVGAL